MAVGNIPSHTHSFSGSATSAGSHGHTASLSLSGLTTGSAGGHTHTVNRRVCSYGPNFGNTGSNTAIASERILSGSAAGSADTTSSSSGAHAHSISGSGTVSITSNGAHIHTVTGTIGNTGSGQAHENRPPYYALCYIMKL